MLSKNSEISKKKYETAIAYFRSCMMKNPKDSYAAVLRARLYAEQGSFYKAEEIIKVLGKEEREALTAYINSCRASFSSDSNEG